MMDYISTPDLLGQVRDDSAATERELMLADRLVSALEEIDALQQALARMAVEAFT